MRARRERTRGGAALHNMSAPPRTTIEVRPLRARGEDRRKEREASAPGAEAGLVLVTTVSLPVLLGRHFPGYEDAGPDDGPARWHDGEESAGEPGKRASLRLRCLVVLSALAVGAPGRHDRQAVEGLADASVEELEAAWLTNVGRLRPEELGLPPFGLVRPAPSPGPLGEETEASLARALAVVSRTGGSVYCASREPVLPDYQRPFRPLRLYGVGRGEPGRD